MLRGIFRGLPGALETPNFQFAAVTTIYINIRVRKIRTAIM